MYVCMYYYYYVLLLLYIAITFGTMRLFGCRSYHSLINTHNIQKSISALLRLTAFTLSHSTFQVHGNSVFKFNLFVFIATLFNIVSYVKVIGAVTIYKSVTGFAIIFPT